MRNVFEELLDAELSAKSKIDVLTVARALGVSCPSLEYSTKRALARAINVRARAAEARARGEIPGIETENLTEGSEL